MLRLSKIQSFVEGKLADLAHAVPADGVQLLCNHAVLPPEMSLASARQFVWKAHADMVLSYRLVNPVPGRRPAPQDRQGRVRPLVETQAEKKENQRR